MVSVQQRNAVEVLLLQDAVVAFAAALPDVVAQLFGPLAALQVELLAAVQELVAALLQVVLLAAVQELVAALLLQPP